MYKFKEEYRKELLPYIIALLFGPSGQLKIFVTSGLEPDIEVEFISNRFLTIHVEVKRLAADIASYVQHVLRSRPHIYRCLDIHLAEEVMSALVSRPNGI